jgi:hypothetical protein
MITVSQLTKSALKSKEVENMIKEQLFIIDEKLLKTKKSWGRNVITHELPTTFTHISTGDRIDIQRFMYSTILQNLQKRGFDIKISLNPDTTILYIAWICEYSKSEMENMDSIIKKNVISSDNINSFINKK